jgi:hypothetical protein
MDTIYLEMNSVYPFGAACILGRFFFRNLERREEIRPKEIDEQPGFRVRSIAL